MSAETPTQLPKEVEKNPEIPAFRKKDTLQARIAFPGPDFSNLNPQKRDIAVITPDTLDPTLTDSLIQQRSNEERIRTAKGTPESWRKDMVDHFKTKDVADYFKNTDQGKKYATELNKVLGIDVTNLTEAHAEKIYTRFCADMVNGNTTYVTDILNAYKDISELENVLGAFEWFGKILGDETRQILAQKIHLKKRLETDEGKKELCDTVNKDGKINNPDNDESRSLKFLYGDGKGVTASAKPATTPTTKPVATETNGNNSPLKLEVADEAYLNEKKIDPEIKKPNHDLVEIFKNLRYKNVDPARIGSWFIPNPPTDLSTIRDDEIRRLIPTTQQRFIGPNGHTNDEAIPHVWDLMVPQRLKKEDGVDTKYPNPPVNRFTEAANRLTNDDSSLIALSAVASSDPEKQAQVYNDIAQILITTFRQYPGIYTEWLRTQDHDKGRLSMNSLGYYKSEDAVWFANNGNDERYRALPRNTSGELDTTSTAWSSRITELDEAIKKNQFTLYQHRWLETMSKAVDIREVIKLIKSKQPSTS